MYLKKKIFIFVALLACGCVGCESDATKTITPDPGVTGEPNNVDCSDACTIGDRKCASGSEIAVCEKTGNACPEWVTDENCGSGTHCDEETLECAEGCADICSGSDETRCSEDGLFTCKTDEFGCAVWEKKGSCPDGTYCNLGTGKCVEKCPESCESGAAEKCVETGIDICENDKNGCGIHHVEPCAQGRFCDEETIKCIPCKETCSSATPRRCSDKGVESCSPTVQGCAEWTLTETCLENQSCDPETMKCIDGCKNACTAGEKKCDEGGVSECKDSDGDGCTEWSEPAACPGGLTCDEATASCKCHDECKAGEKKCEGSNMLTCAANSSGCLAWGNPEPCGQGKSCNSEQTACEYTCGTDCEPFSIMLIPDTQNYAKTWKSYPDEKNIYTRQMKWIAENQKKENIRAAIHLGDITDWNAEGQWKIADYAHKYLDKADIPYSISTGNHDYGSDCGNKDGGCSREVSRIEHYFGKERFKDKSWYHPSPFEGNSYITFSVGNIKFLVLALEFAVRQDVMCWANEVIQKHPDHHVIVETHNYLTTNASQKNSGSAFGSNGYSGGAYLPNASQGAGGFDLFHGVVARHNNVIMAVCGHVGDSEMRQKKGYNGNTVTEMLVDYQFDAPCSKSSPDQCTNSCFHGNNAGNGWMRQLIFDPKTNEVKAKTLTVLKNSEFAGSKPMFYCSQLNKDNKQWYNKDVNAKDHQFTFTCDFTSSVDYKYTDNNYVGFPIRNINSIGDGHQLKPAVALHRTTGTMVAVWEDNASGDDGKATAGAKKGQSNHDLEARVFYNGGCQKVAQFSVNVNKAGDQITPAVAMDKDSNFVIVWADDSDGDGAYDIMMRGFDENGKERIKPTVVNSKTNGNQINPAISMAPDGRFVVAWEDGSDNADTPQIFIRGFDVNGNQTFADRNAETLAGVRRKPSVGIADDGSFVVTWEDDTDMNGMFQINAKGFKADGTDRINTFTVNTHDEGQQLNPSISMNGAGVFYIAYEDDEDKNGVYRIKSHGYKADGKELTEDMWISDSGEDAVDPVLCVNKNNEVVYAWTAKALHSGDVRLRSYREGKLKSNHTVNIELTAGVQDQPAMGCTEDGRSAVLWHDDVDKNGYFEIYGRGFNEM
ncbi:MAG: metallophosphoesterase [Proteobacteria bacterium]|nr:metallophosphoesterase [Pseudomonadota bacterium]